MAERNLGRVQGNSIWTSDAPLTDYGGNQYQGSISVKKINGVAIKPLAGDKIVNPTTGNVYAIATADTGSDTGDSVKYTVTTESKVALFTLKGDKGEKGEDGADFDANTSTVAFAEAQNNDKIASGETLSTLFGKTSRLFTRTSEAENDITSIKEDITISDETIEAFKAIGWDPSGGGQ